MNKDKYIKEIEGLHMNDDFKQKMKENLYQETQQVHKKTWNMKVVSLCVISACLLLTFIYTNSQPKVNPIPDIISHPSVQIDKIQPNVKVPSQFYPYISFGEGYGHAGVVVKDKSDLRRHNPYDLNHPSSTMPIYYNLQRIDNDGNMANELGEKEKKAILKNYAKRLQIKDYVIEKLEFNNDYKLQSQYYTIEISEYGVLIEFSEEYMKYNSIDMKVNNQKEADELTLKLYEKYKNLFDIHKPMITTTYDYSIDGEINCRFSISEQKEDQSESLIYSQTNSISFWESEDHKLNSIYIDYVDLSGKVGDYPIITVEEAIKKLMNGQYQSTVGEISDIEVGYIEMTYKTSLLNEYFLPYYQFYVYYGEEGDLKDYTLCWVCAIDDAYINDKYLTEQYNYQ